MLCYLAKTKSYNLNVPSDAIPILSGVTSQDTILYLLCYVMLCYVMLCYVILIYVMLCYTLVTHKNVKNATH